MEGDPFVLIEGMIIACYANDVHLAYIYIRGEFVEGAKILNRALKEARAAEQEIRAGNYRGPLHGIPYGAKDLLATKGIPTTWGAAPYKDQVFDYDATVIHKLRNAGAILSAKLAMVELAGGFGYNNADASFTGPGRTPWNTAYWSGGSSADMASGSRMPCAGNSSPDRSAAMCKRAKARVSAAALYC